MISLQYVNDLALACAKQTLKDEKLYFTRIIFNVLKVEKYRDIFLLEFRNYLYSVGVDKGLIDEYTFLLKN